MQTLKEIIKVSDPLQSSDSHSLTTRSGPQLPAELVGTLGLLMAQTQARFPNQVLPPGTPDMYLVEWEEMALKYGMANFAGALSKVIRDADFFPSPKDIRLQLEAMARSERDQREAREFTAKYEALLEDKRLHPEKYFSMGEIAAEIMARIREKPAKEVPPPVSHSVTTKDTGDGVFQQSCTCGLKWETIGAVPTCHAEHAARHMHEACAGLEAHHAAKAGAA